MTRSGWWLLATGLWFGASGVAQAQPGGEAKASAADVETAVAAEAPPAATPADEKARHETNGADATPATDGAGQARATPTPEATADGGQGTEVASEDAEATHAAAADGPTDDQTTAAPPAVRFVEVAPRTAEATDTPPEGIGKLAIALQWTQRFYSDASYDLVREDNTQPGFGAWVGYDHRHPRHRLQLASNVGLAYLDSSAQVRDAIDTELESYELLVGGQVRYAWLQVLQPHARVMLGTMHTRLRLEGLDGSRDDDFSRWDPTARAGIGFGAYLPRSMLGPRAPLSFGLEFEYGMSFLPATPARYGNTELQDVRRTAQYFAISLVGRR